MTGAEAMARTIHDRRLGVGEHGRFTPECICNTLAAQALRTLESYGHVLVSVETYSDEIGDRAATLMQLDELGLMRRRESR